MISFIVPALNEENNIVPTTKTIISASNRAELTDYEIILVDDGSTDGTAKVIAELSASSPRIRSLRHPINCGLGTSIRDALDIAHFPSFMVVPGDNDMPEELITVMLLFRNEADIILTAPLNKEQRSRIRNIVSMIYQIAYMLAFNIFVNYVNGPGIWPTAAARAAKLQAQRFSIISELNVKTLRMGHTFAEVPGYFQAGPKTRRTITIVNLREVILSFVFLLREIHFRRRQEFALRPARKQIDFLSRFASGR